MKANARSYLRVYVQRGKVKFVPCRDCGSTVVEGHHPDHRKPLEVIWLCREHHLREHRLTELVR